MTHVEESGRTVDEAIARALETLGVTHDDVEIEVLTTGARGMLGLGARDARVRVTVKQGAAAVARGLAMQMFALMGHSPSVHVDHRDDGVYVDAEGAVLGVLIGRHGATLDAIDLLLEAMTVNQTGERVKVVLDIEGYRARRYRTLEALARKTGRQVHNEGRAVALEPMGARDRRLIHTTLAGDPDVVTYSEGEEPLRRVVIAQRVETPPPPDSGGLASGES